MGLGVTSVGRDIQDKNDRSRSSLPLCLGLGKTFLLTSFGFISNFLNVYFRISVYARSIFNGFNILMKNSAIT